MVYKLIRHDNEVDALTKLAFDNYDDAYDVLEEVYADICCSDADYDDRPYYEIVEIEEEV